MASFQLYVDSHPLMLCYEVTMKHGVEPFNSA